MADPAGFPAPHLHRRLIACADTLTEPADVFRSSVAGAREEFADGLGQVVALSPEESSAAMEAFDRAVMRIAHAMVTHRVLAATG